MGRRYTHKSAYAVVKEKKYLRNESSVNQRRAFRLLEEKCPLSKTSVYLYFVCFKFSDIFCINMKFLNFKADIVQITNYGITEEQRLEGASGGYIALIPAHSRSSYFSLLLPISA